MNPAGRCFVTISMVAGGSVMTMETLASFHVFISFNLHIFDNHLVTCRMSTCVTICHTSKVVPQRRYNKCYFGYSLKECKSQHFLHYKF